MSTGVDEAAPADPVSPSRHPSRRTWWVAGLVVVLVLAAGVAAWEWRHSDQSFPDSYGIKVRRQVGQPVWTSLVHSGRSGADEITIMDLEPVIENDGAEANVEYLVCELDPEVLAAERVGGFGYAMNADDLSRYCASTKPAEGATFGLRVDPPQELLVGVTPTRSGRTVISGHTIDFQVGWQRGEDEIAVEMVLVARGRADQR